MKYFVRDHSPRSMGSFLTAAEFGKPATHCGYPCYLKQ